MEFRCFTTHCLSVQYASRLSLIFILTITLNYVHFLFNDTPAYATKTVYGKIGATLAMSFILNQRYY